MVGTVITLPDSRQLVYSLDPSPKNAPIVILSNCLATSLTVWDHIVPILNQEGFRTLRYNHPGHGGSSPPESLDKISLESMADDVAVLLKALGIPKVHSWIGVSLGGAVGAYFVTRHPGVVRKLALCDTSTCSPVNASIDDFFAAPVAKARADGHMDNVVQWSLEQWFGTTWLETNKAEAERMRSLMLTTTVGGFEACSHALQSEGFGLRPLFGKVGAAVEDAICVVGQKDENLTGTMEEMRAAIEKGFESAGKPMTKINLAVINNAGHVCFIDGLGQFVDSILAFLKL